jgi:diaminopimelate decarboxylase
MRNSHRQRARGLRFVDPATFTPQFSWKQSDGKAGGPSVACEDVSLVEVAEKVGTPTYVYSREAIVDAYGELHAGLSDLPHTLCFAVKSNGNLSILKTLADLGSGFDVVSGGELCHLRRIGVRGDRIVFSGVGKTREEMREALAYPAPEPGRRAGILLFNVESEPELDALLEEASRQPRASGEAPSVAMRVNPDVQAGGHPHISTGRHTHKFGLDWAQARKLYLAHRDSKWIRWQGLSVHIGSQIVALEPFRSALRRLAAYVGELRKAGIPLKYLDFGGGLGVRYTDEKPPSREAYARLVAQLVQPLGLHLLLEPGRTIIGAAGVLLTRVLYVKKNRGKTFVVVDAAMNDLMRPALYDAIHPITRVTSASCGSKGLQRVDIVGPVCETGDCFLRDWPLGDVEPGNLLAIWVTGAYGMSLASNYNARARGAEVLVDGNSYHVIRWRETSDDLLRGDVLADPTPSEKSKRTQA